MKVMVRSERRFGLRDTKRQGCSVVYDPRQGWSPGGSFGSLFLQTYHVVFIQLKEH